MSETATVLGAETTNEGTPDPKTTANEIPSPPAPEAGGETQDKPPEAEPAKSPDESKEGEKEGGETKEVLKAGDEPPAGAPETYELKAPEGHPELDKVVLDPFQAAVRKLNLSNEGAQSILDEVLPALEAQRTEVMQAARTEWVKTTQTDKQLGGENLKQNLTVANRGLERFGSPALVQFLTDSGLAEHPEIIRLCFNAGSQISEDKGPVKAGSGETGTEVDVNDPDYVLSKLYPNHPQKT